VRAFLVKQSLLLEPERPQEKAAIREASLPSMVWNGRRVYICEDPYSQVLQFVDSRLVTDFRELWRHAVNASWMAQAAPPPGWVHIVPQVKDLRPYQVAGVLEANRRLAIWGSVLIGDEMGLGKTAQACVLARIQAPPGRNNDWAKPVLVICPASVKEFWRRELMRWGGYNPSEIVVGPPWGKPNYARVLVVNYARISTIPKETLAKIVEEWGFGMVILDECQKIKNPSSLRSKKIRGLKIPLRVLLSGTPILNRPAEFWSLLNWMRPSAWPNKWAYFRRYCDAQPSGFGGMDVSGNSNLRELNVRLRGSIMIRRLKEMVLKDLPAKTRQIVPVTPEGVVKRTLRTLEGLLGVSSEDFAQGPEDFQEMVLERLARVSRPGLSGPELATARRELGENKVPYVIQHIGDLLETLEEDNGRPGKLVVFAYHNRVLDLLKANLEDLVGEVAVIRGATPQGRRQAVVDAFQDPQGPRIFLGQIQAAGVGITLTAAQTVVFAEPDWVPANLIQAEDRVHRLGQEGNVLIQYLVWEDSLDEYILQAMVEKMKVLEKTLN